jgi:hypothetical protein
MSEIREAAHLLFEPGVMVTSVPWQLRSTTRQAQPALIHSATDTTQHQRAS